jgi:hypothetical protein
MADKRQITVLKSLFQTLHPYLETGLHDTRRLLARLHPTQSANDEAVLLPAIERTKTDEHLLLELHNATRQPQAREPRRATSHYSRNALLALLDDARQRIEVLETELELARGVDDNIPLLTEEWTTEVPAQISAAAAE